MTKDEALRLALEVLEWANKEINNWMDDAYGLEPEEHPEIMQAITAIKAALEANEFNPDWDTQAVLAEEIQRMAKRIEELEARREPVAWATREDFYRELEHAMNHMRQQMKIKSVTMRCTDYDLALPIIDIFDGRILVGQVITPPQRTWVGLTNEEFDQMLVDARFTRTDLMMIGACVDDIRQMIEAKLKEKNT